MGQYYGVIQDPAVKVKTCNKFPYGVGYVSYTVECLDYIIADLEAEKAANPDVRAVINLSFAGSFCWTVYDSQFQESM